MDEKGAINLSFSFIIIVILGALLLAVGVQFIGKVSKILLGQVGTLTGEIERKVMNELDKEGKFVLLVPNNKIGRDEKDPTFYYGVENDWRGKVWFEVNIRGNPGCDPCANVELTKMFRFIPDVDTLPEGKKTGGVVRISVDRNTPLGNYDLIAWVCIIVDSVVQSKKGNTAAADYVRSACGSDDDFYQKCTEFDEHTKPISQDTQDPGCKHEHRIITFEVTS
jgi:hypothetical protein